MISVFFLFFFIFALVLELCYLFQFFRNFLLVEYVEMIKKLGTYNFARVMSFAIDCEQNFFVIFYDDLKWRSIFEKLSKQTS